jgi:hypothetical protein
METFLRPFAKLRVLSKVEAQAQDKKGFLYILTQLILPPTIVYSTFVSNISSGFTPKMSLDKTTISANFPIWIDPLIFSS